LDFALMAKQLGFSGLTPDVLIDAVEQAVGTRMTGLAHALASYINRVYELQTADGTRLIAKFYRPGRWSREAVRNEHDFVAECAADEIPVVPPMTLADGSTVGVVDDIFFAVYPKRLGREFEPISEEDWRRLGRVIGRMHAVGARGQASHREVMHPAQSTAAHVRRLLDGGFVTARHRESFEQATDRVMAVIRPMFEGVEMIRIHGDCHRGNILERPEEGLALIDFDDMVTGPPVQDLWMLLPEHAGRSQREIDLIIEGYELFRTFDPHTPNLIEPLRAMRLLYFLAWCSTQIDDPAFVRNFPDWGSDVFWRKQVSELYEQYSVICDHLG